MSGAAIFTLVSAAIAICRVVANNDARRRAPSHFLRSVG